MSDGDGGHIYYQIRPRMPGFSKFIILAVSSLLALNLVTSCIAKAEAPSVEWYADNPEDRQRTLRWCRSHPGPASRSDNCLAAWSADVLVEIRRGEAQIGAGRSRAPGPPRGFELFMPEPPPPAPPPPPRAPGAPRRT